jgi:hypothetical protein
MELFERTKAILLNPKEEWQVIEAEDKPQAKVFIEHLLPLALIPAAAKFFAFWWAWRQTVNKAISVFDSYGNNSYLAEAMENVKKSIPFDVSLGIIQAVTMLVIIIGSAYIAAYVINVVADKNGSEKNFDHAFSLSAYSFTPLCVAGLLYLYSPLSVLVSIAGLYGIYLLYIGLAPIMKPAAEKVTGFFVVALIAALGSWFILSSIVPDITNNIYKNYKIEQAKDSVKKAMNNNY